MDNKELNENIEKNTPDKDGLNTQKTETEEINEESQDQKLETEIKEDEKLTPEKELEIIKDKLARTFAEMENQRRRFEKEKEDAYEYGGYSFAREALNLLDNLERSKVALENDDKLKGTDALKKIVDHLNIINNDMLSIFKKNNIEPVKIIQEIQKGFMMKDRLLRPSLVGVSKKKIKEEKKEEGEDEKNQ